MKRFIPPVAVALSLVPGLAIWLEGKHRQSMWLWLALAVAVVLFSLFPSLVTWYLFCAIYLGQMVYSAWLAVLKQPEKVGKEILLNANPEVPLPEIFRSAKKIDQLVYDELAREIRPDRDLKIAILGLDIVSSRYKFYGATEQDLIIADCTSSGHSRSGVRIPRDKVAWVNLLVGERNCIIEIRYEGECYPSVRLRIPSKLKNQAIQFVKEFPGTWDYDKSQMEVIHSIHKIDWRPEVWIPSLISFGCIVFGALPYNDQLALSILNMVSFTFGFFLLTWPYIFWLLREFKKEPALTSANGIRMFFLLPSILFAWWMAFTPPGVTAIKIVQMIWHKP